MKHFIKQINLNLLSLIVSFIVCSNSTAQLCANSNPDIGTNAPVPNITFDWEMACGNDVWEEDDLKFTVWVSAYGISYDYVDDYGGSGTETYHFEPPGANTWPNNFVRSPDVVITKFGTQLFASAVFFCNDDQTFYLSTWELIQDPFTSNSYIFDVPTYTALETRTIGPENISIRIDANSNGDFAIVWDSYDNGTMRTVVGYTDGSAPTVANTPLDLIGLPTNSAYILPDVAISESSTQGVANVFYVYLVAAKDELIVSYGNYDDLALGTASNVYIDSRYPPTSDYVFDHYWPRIACPNDAGSMNDWSVVWEMLEFTENRSDVLGITHEGSTIYPIGADYYIYTNGSQTLPGSTAQIDKEMYPCVAYDHAGNNIQISFWGDYDNNSKPLLLALSLNNQGEPVGTCFETVSSYGDDGDENIVKPSLTGRHGHTMNVAFVNRYWNPGVWHKDFDWSGVVRNSGLGTSPIITTIINADRSNNLSDNILIYPNPVTDNLKIEINNFNAKSKYCYILIDQSGRGIRTDKVYTKNQIISVQNLQSGLYFIKFMENETKLSCVKKFLKM